MLKPLYFFFGLLVGICTGATVFLISVEEIVAAVVDYAALIALYLVGLTVGAFAVFFLIRRIVIKKMGLNDPPSAGGLVDRVFEVLRPGTQMTLDDRYDATNSLVKGGVVWFFSSMGYLTLLNAVIAVIAIFAGTVASLLLFKQNELIAEQKKSDLLQAVLAESARRSVQYTFVNDLLIRLQREENYEKDQQGRATVRADLMRDLEVALDQMQPYAVATFDTNTFTIDGDVQESVDVSFLSPEKGLVLSALADLGSFGAEQIKVVTDGDFSNADYRNYPGADIVPNLDCSTAMEVSKAEWNTGFFIKDMADFFESNFTNADFRGSRVTALMLGTFPGMRLNDTRFEGSVVATYFTPEGKLNLKNSILDLSKAYDIRGLFVEMHGGCIIYNSIILDPLSAGAIVGVEYKQLLTEEGSAYVTLHFPADGSNPTFSNQTKFE